MSTLDRVKEWKRKHPERVLAANRAYYYRHHERRKAYMREYYRKHREEILKKAKKYYPGKKAKLAALPAEERKRVARENWRKWYYKRKVQRPEAARESWRKRYWKAAEYSRAQSRKSYYKHREKRLERQKLYYEPVDLFCSEGCGRKTVALSGMCRKCSHTQCRKCKKNFYAEYVGQRVHERCLGREG